MLFLLTYVLCQSPYLTWNTRCSNLLPDWMWMIMINVTTTALGSDFCQIAGTPILDHNHSMVHKISFVYLKIFPWCKQYLIPHHLIMALDATLLLFSIIWTNLRVTLDFATWTSFLLVSIFYKCMCCLLFESIISPQWCWNYFKFQNTKTCSLIFSLNLQY